jgi:hypothetical protein
MAWDGTAPACGEHVNTIRYRIIPAPPAFAASDVSDPLLGNLPVLRHLVR